MRAVLIVLVFLASCTTAEIVKDQNKRAAILAMPEVVEILDAHGIGDAALKERFCKMPPEQRLFIRIEVGQILKEDLGVKLPRCR